MPVRYQQLPETDLSASVVALGTAPFGTGIDESLAVQFLDAYVEQGGNFIDTAHTYGGWEPSGIGRSEQVIGKWLRDRQLRDRVIIGSKRTHPLFSSIDISPLSAEEIVGDLEESLRCLQTEVIDLYWLQRDDPAQPVAAILETLQEQVRKGKVRYFGCSTWRLSRLGEAHRYARDHNTAGFVGNQLMWSYAVPDLESIEDRTLVAMDAPTYAFHRQTGLAVMAFTSQRQGYFSNYDASAEDLPESIHQINGSPENTARLRRLREVAAWLTLPLSTAALAYLANQPFPTYPIFSCATVRQLLENAGAGDVLLDAATLRYLETGESS
jgi:aryl-alcohol dehydrogenase-like predicted oxidoreductase